MFLCRINNNNNNDDTKIVGRVVHFNAEVEEYREHTFELLQQYILSYKGLFIMEILIVFLK